MGAVYQLCNEIGKQGVEVHILSAIRLPDKKNHEYLSSPKKEGSTLIHFFDLRWLPLTGFFCLALSKLFYLFYSIKLHRKYKFDIIHDYSSTPFSFFNAFFYSLLKIKSVCTICTKSRVNFFDNKFVWNFAKTVDRVIITSKYFYQKISSLIGEVDTFSYISLGVNRKKLLLSRKQESKLKVFFIGSYDINKGTDLFFKAAEKFPELDFVWITLEFKFKPEKVKIITGIVDLGKHISFGDICLLPYKNLDGILLEPQTILDAMAIGSVVITSDFPQLRAIAKDSVSYFPAGKFNKLAERIKSLSSSKENRLKLAYRANAIIDQNYSRDKSVKEIINLYKEVLKN